MFVGHLALGFGAKRWVPAVGLGWLVAAVIGVDLLWPIFLLAGVERLRIVEGATAVNPFVFEHYPWTHSLLMGLAWGVLLGVIARGRGIRAGDAVVVGALVVSHWLLDAVTHVPDLPLWPGISPRVGLGLWNSLVGTFAIEGAMWVAGIAVYLNARPVRGRRAAVAFWSFVGLATVIWAAGPWSPPPPSVQAVAWLGLVTWLLVPWAAAADRRRSPEE